MRKLNAIIFPALVPLILAGCDQAPTNAADSAKAQELAKSVAALSEKVNRVDAVNNIQARHISQLMTEVRELSGNKAATFDPSDPSYRRVDANVGLFAVSLANVRPFADGVKVTLKLGNLAAADFRGAKLTLEYGTREPDIDKDADAWGKWADSTQSREQAITSTLKSGGWNPVEVVLPNIKADEFGYLELSIETNTLALASR